MHVEAVWCPGRTITTAKTAATTTTTQDLRVLIKHTAIPQTLLTQSILRHRCINRIAKTAATTTTTQDLTVDLDLFVSCCSPVAHHRDGGTWWCHIRALSKILDRFINRTRGIF